VNATDGGVPSRDDVDFERPFAADSVWNTPIGDDPEIDPDSDEMIARFAEVFEASGGIAVSYRQDAVPVYMAEPETPRVDVTLTDSATGADTLADVPLPEQALPDCGFDTLLAAFDPAADLFYEFWRAVKNDDGTWRATTANTIDISGSGIYPGDGAGSVGIRASGFSLLAGMIWPHEFEAGAIDHAIVFIYTAVREGAPVPPATATDGPIDEAAALPMGSLLQLDPALDLDTLDLDPWERSIAVALQTYGMYLGDTGGGIGISLLHGYSFEGNPYDGLLPPEAESDGVVFLTKLPAASFRVLQPPAE
ncbi:MAG: hypothetical protein GY778_10445, partial [bacterium]|nr:hypothetical protein [bacterium]